MLILRIWSAAGGLLKTTGSRKRGRVGMAIKVRQIDKERSRVQTATHCNRIESSGIDCIVDGVLFAMLDVWQPIIADSIIKVLPA